jgi:metallo-beta-lactamase family protein
MTITFFGAAHEVTGSCTLIKANGKNIIVDYGMEQGKDIFENQELSVPAIDIDYVLLTHAHIDHSGLIPLLYAKGFNGRVYATESTTRLCEIMLRDSAHIQEFEAEWRNRKAKRSGAEKYEPLYTIDDAVGSMKLFRPCPYDTVVTVDKGLEVRFTDAGHLLGSASIEVWVTEDKDTEKLVFSGDIGNLEQPLLKDPTYLTDADYVIMESTYGNRSHGDRPNYIGDLVGIIQRTFDRGGNLVIPSFAVGRTQELLYFIREIKEQNLIKGHNNFRVYVDSPLAVEATGIYSSGLVSYYDEETLALLEQGIDPIQFKGLNLAITSDDSRAINENPSPKVIISASGMCEAGRIRHHLKHNLWKENNIVLFVGYQAEDSLGRRLLNGEKNVTLFGEEISVNAKICALQGTSGHADKEGLIKWLSAFKTKPSMVFVNHGDDDSCKEFTETLTHMGYKAEAPYSGTEYDLANGNMTVFTQGKPVDRVNLYKGTARADLLFNELVTEAEKLLRLVKTRRGRPNKENAKLTSQIRELISKWKD